MTATISDGLSLKTTLEGFSPQQFDALKQVATYYRLIRLLRSTGWANLFWGGLTLWLGLAALRPNIFTDVQVYLGFIIIGQSLLAIVRPSKYVLLALISILLFCGTWNLFITFYNGFSDLTLLIGLLGIFQLRWAYRTYLSYKLFIGLPFSKPDAEISQQYDTIWEGLSNPAPLLSPELLTMQFGRDRHWWNGILLPNDAAFAHKRQKVLMFVAKPELIIVAENPNAVNRDKFAIFAQIGKESLVGKIDRVGFQQYMTWKGISDPEAEVGKSLRRKRLARKMLRWIMILIILGFLLLLVLPLFVVARYG